MFLVQSNQQNWQSYPVRQNENIPAGTGKKNYVILYPAIFGGVAAFVTGFGFYGCGDHRLSGRTLALVDIYALIAALGTGFYILNLLGDDDEKIRDFEHLKKELLSISLPIFITIFFFGSVFNLVYSLDRQSFEGTIGKKKITQYLSFLALSIGDISVGDSLGISPARTGTQVLLAVESIFTLFALSLLISLFTK